MNINRKLILCLLNIILLQTISAQTTTTFSKESLMGKKWTRRMTFQPSNMKEACDEKVIEVETKKITIKVGEVIEISQIFNNDSVICKTKIGTEVVSELHYAYYLSDSFAFVFDDLKVGMNDRGNWLNTHNEIIVNGRKRKDGASLKIVSLTDEKLSLTFPGSSNLIEWTAEPLNE